MTPMYATPKNIMPKENQKAFRNLSIINVLLFSIYGIDFE
jgi:hypothetical protein